MTPRGSPESFSEGVTISYARQSGNPEDNPTRKAAFAQDSVASATGATANNAPTTREDSDTTTADSGPPDNTSRRTRPYRDRPSIASLILKRDLIRISSLSSAFTVLLDAKPACRCRRGDDGGAVATHALCLHRHIRLVIRVPSLGFDFQDRFGRHGVRFFFARLFQAEEPQGRRDFCATFFFIFGWFLHAAFLLEFPREARPQ